MAIRIAFGVPGYDSVCRSWARWGLRRASTPRRFGELPRIDTQAATQSKYVASILQLYAAYCQRKFSAARGTRSLRYFALVRTHPKRLNPNTKGALRDW